MIHCPLCSVNINLVYKYGNVESVLKSDIFEFHVLFCIWRFWDNFCVLMQQVYYSMLVTQKVTMHPSFVCQLKHGT